MVTNDNSNCPRCGGYLKYYDKVLRIVKTKNRITKRIEIDRLKCIECKSVHRKLPDYILPYKHYEKELIAGVVNGYITCETLGYEDYPCEQTMNRWISQNLQGVL